MKYLKYYIYLKLICLYLTSSAQCSFQYISNDTLFQDYIEFIYPKKNVDEIIALGSLINRGIINDTIFNAPIFQTFDYCGNILNQTIYKFIGNYKLKHSPFPTHNTYKEEPIGNSVIKIKNDGFLLVDKAVDTLLKQQVLILYKINDTGGLKNYKTLTLNNQEANQTTIKNVIELKDGRSLVILWDNADEYYFYYFDENLDFLLKKSFSLGRGIRSIKALETGEFICTSLTDVKASFQFYRLDTIESGEIKWITTPYDIFGSAREVLIENNRIYVTGGTSLFGVFIISDLDGTIMKEFKYDTFYCKQEFCSAYLDSDNSFVIGGYIEHCEPTNENGYDVAIIKIDSNGAILWNKLFDFRNALGTSDTKGYYNDYGGFSIAKANDNGNITNGMSRYRRLSMGGILHQDALLIKTIPLVVTNIDLQTKKGNLEFHILENPLHDNLHITGPVDIIKKWIIYNLQGKVILQGNSWSGMVKTSSMESEIYIIQIIDSNNFKYFFRFVKV